ncbi:MAG: hypothetical protein ABIU76_03900 [Gemmatimonadaceae bacterium]
MSTVAPAPIDTKYVAAQVARWEALGVTIPAIIPEEANWLNTPERMAATWRCPMGADSWSAPDVVIVRFATDVDANRRRKILDQVRGRVVASPSGFFYLVWLRPTGRCDADKVAAELRKIDGVRMAVPNWYTTFGAAGAPTRP